MQRRSLELENDGATVVAAQAYRVHQNPTRSEVAEARAATGDGGNPGKNPDFLIEGHVFDCYSPTSTRSTRGVWTEVSNKVEEGQTERVVLNLHDWGGNFASLQRQFNDWPIAGLKELVAITRSGAIFLIVKLD